MKSRLPFLFAAILAATVATNVSRSEEIAATNMDSRGFIPTGWAYSVGYTDPRIGYSNETVGQEFVPQTDGTLSTLSATVDKFVGGEPLDVSLYTGVGGIPATHIATLTVPETEVATSSSPDWPITTFDFSAFDISLVAGESYIVVFSVDTALYQSSRYRALLTGTNAESFGIRAIVSPDGGTSWNVSNVAPEVGLIVCVEPLGPPEPIEVAIDVDPRSTKNSVNLNSKNPKPLVVALLGSDELAVDEVVPHSALLGDPVLTDPEFGSGIPATPTYVEFRDVNSDGLTDLIFDFDVLELQALGAIDAASTSVQLDVELTNGGTAFGLDVVNVKGKKGKGKGKP